MGRPRRTAALRANVAITDMADSDRPMSRDRRSRGGPATVSRDPPSSPGDHLNLNIKVSSNKLRQATVGRDGVRTEQQISVNSGRDSGAGGSRRSRGSRKNYVVESDSDDEEEDEELDLGDDDEEDDDEDAEGEEDADGEADEMDLDADGEADDDAGDEDADGDVDMEGEDSTITVSKPKGGSRAKGPAVANPAQRALYEEDDDDDELSDPGPSDVEESITYGAGAGADEDAEGEEIEVAGEDEEGEDEGEEEDEEELDSDGMPIGGEAPDLTKMTRRQRARFEDKPQDYMKLSDGGLSLGFIDGLRVGRFTDAACRGASQEDLYGRGNLHAPGRDGAAAAEPEREAQRGSKGIVPHPLPCTRRRITNKAPARNNQQAPKETSAQDQQARRRPRGRSSRRPPGPGPHHD